MINQPWSFAPYWLQQHIARYNILVDQVFRDRGIVGRLKHVGGCNAAPIWNWPLSRLVGGWLSKKGWNPPEGSSCNTKSAGDWLIKATTVYLSRSTGCLNWSTLHNHHCKIWKEPGYTQTAVKYLWNIKHQGFDRFCQKWFWFSFPFCLPPSQPLPLGARRKICLWPPLWDQSSRRVIGDPQLTSAGQKDNDFFPNALQAMRLLMLLVMWLLHLLFIDNIFS